MLAAQLAVGLTIGRRYCLPCLLYFELIQPRFGEGPLEDARPPRFANMVGLVVLTARERSPTPPGRTRPVLRLGALVAGAGAARGDHGLLRRVHRVQDRLRADGPPVRQLPAASSTASTSGLRSCGSAAPERADATTTSPATSATAAPAMTTSSAPGSRSSLTPLRKSVVARANAEDAVAGADGEVAADQDAGDRAEQEPAHGPEGDVAGDDVAEAGDPEQRGGVHDVGADDLRHRQREEEHHRQPEERAAADRA